MGTNISRKGFITASALALAAIPLSGDGFSNEIFGKNLINKQGFESDKLKVCIFSKHLQWLNYYDMAFLAAEMGFDGIDLTVRPGGHVLPERVEDDLPEAVEAVEKAGIKIHMLTTNIQEANQKYTESILRTASKLGIKHYRTGWLDYNEKIDIHDNLRLIKKKFMGLEEINSRYGIKGDYQNHAGKHFGASVWDLWLILKEMETNFMGCHYDIRHATVEGANTWSRGLQLINSHINTISIKDFQWRKDGDKSEVENVQLGKGIVDLVQYFELIKKYKVLVPISLHCEYPLGGAEDGAEKLTISREQFVTTVRKDLMFLRKLLEGT